MDAKSGHVRTKDLGIVRRGSPALADLMGKGTKFRDAPAELFHTGNPTADTVPDRIMYMVGLGLDRYVEEQVERLNRLQAAGDTRLRLVDLSCGGSARGPLEEWSTKVLALVSAAVAELSAAQLATIDAEAGKLELTESVREELAVLQQEYVFAEADKESGVYTVWCQRDYSTTLLHECSGKGSSSYVQAGRGARARVQKELAGPEGVEKVKVWVPEPGTDYYALMRAHAAWLKARGYSLATLDDEGHFAPRLTFSDGSVETEEEQFIRGSSLAYLYALLKTHKVDAHGLPCPSPRFIAGGTNNSLRSVNTWLHRALVTVKGEFNALFAALFSKVEATHLPLRFANPCKGSWMLEQSSDAVSRVLELNNDLRRLRSIRRRVLSGELTKPAWLDDAWADNVTQVAKYEFGVWDFTTLYPSLPHAFLYTELGRLVRHLFSLHGGCSLLVRRAEPEDPSATPVCWVPTVAGAAAPRGCRLYDADELLEAVQYILANALVTLGDTVYRQESGVPAGYVASPDIAQFALASREYFKLQGALLQLSLIHI